MIDQHEAHGPGRDRQEMRTIRPLHPGLVDQAHVDLMDERRRVQRLTGPAPAQSEAGGPLQLVVREREELVERLSVTLTGAVQEDGRVA